MKGEPGCWLARYASTPVGLGGERDALSLLVARLRVLNRHRTLAPRWRCALVVRRGA